MIPESMVEDDVLGVVREINRLWPNLVVQFLDPDRALLNDPPYRIIERTAQGDKQVMAVWCLDNTVIERLHLANSHRFDIEASIEKHNAKIKAEKEYMAQQQMSEGADLAATAVEHLGKGKLQFTYKKDDGTTRIIREDGTRGDKKATVL